MSGITFHYQVPPFYFPGRNRLKQHVQALFRKEGQPLDALSYVFCTDQDLHQINLRYLAHDTLTDIITFSLAPPGQPVLGDVYISIDRVRENAQLLQVPLQQELRRVVFHGALHLCGYRDKTPREEAQMREREDFYLNRLYRST